jgi:hypothetical protein
VRDIVTDHDAELKVGPGSDGRGTVFSVSFALAQEEQEQVAVVYPPA